MVGVDRPVAHPLERQAEDLRPDPAQRGRGALADLNGRGTDDRPPGGQHLDQRLVMIAGTAAILEADAEPHATPRRADAGRCNAPSVAEAIDNLVETGEQIAVHATVAGLERLADREQVPAAELVGVDTEPARDHVDLRLGGKARLGSAKPTERSGRHRIGAHRIGAGRDRRPAIGAGNAIAGLDDGHRARIEYAPASSWISLCRAVSRPSAMTPVFRTRMPACLDRMRRPSSMLRHNRTGRPALTASSTTSGSILQKLLPPKPPPT